jgi:hypothetical protein
MVSTAPEASSSPPDEVPGDEVPGDEVREADFRRRATSVSAKGPALVVLGLAVLIVLVGTIGSALESGGAPVLTVHQVRLPDGSVVHLTPATTALRSIVSAGQPPADILGNLAVPAGSRVVRTLNISQNASQYDESVDFSTDLSSQDVLSVFHVLLPKQGWSLSYTGSGAGHQAQQTEVLAKHASGDGYYWEAGVVVSPTTPAGITPYSVEVFEIPDDT